MRLLALGITFVIGSLAGAQDRKKEGPAQGYPGVDSKRVDDAIRKGMEFLKKVPSPSAHKAIPNSDELILLAWVVGGLPQSDPAFRESFDRMLQSKFTHTYKVALQAMVLEEVDRVRYQDRIAQCGQALVDSQLKHGQWNYECSTEAVPGTPTPAPIRSGTGGSKGPPKGQNPFRGTPAEGARAKPPIVRVIPLTRSKFSSSDRGDDSNSQYAALGLRACHDAGILIPQEVVELARKWWESSQQGAPAGKPGDRPDVSTGGPLPAPPRGWDYSKGGRSQEKPFGSMTAGAVSAVVIYDFMLKKDWKTDPVVQSGMAWLNEQFTVTTNPQKYPEWHYYYLYALERVGMLYNTWSIGTHDWYREGATLLLDAQKADGSWRAAAFNGAGDGQLVWDTCFAILFLKRATRTLDVASVDPYKK